MAHLDIKIDNPETLETGDVLKIEEVLREAIMIHDEREKVRKGLWKKYSTLDQARQIKVKIERIMHQLEGTFERVEDVGNIKEELLDIINYAIFAYRIADGEFNG